MATKTKTAPTGIDPETGVVECANCVELGQKVDRLEMELKGAERDINAWRIRYEELRRDKEAEAREHELWDPAMDLFALWRKLTGKSRCKFSADRFFLVLPFLKKDGEELCQRAIVGRVFDHYSANRKNGTTIHYFEWERIFANRREFEESANRAPKDWKERLK